MTRREALLLAGAAAGNAHDVSIQPHGDGSAPSVSVSLAGHQTPVAVIEMPEHAWHKKTNSDEPEWFYRMDSNDQRVKAQPKWSREANSLEYSMAVPSGLTMNVKAAIDREGIGIEYRISNPGEPAYAEVQAVTCCKLCRPFTDVFLERTYVHHADGLDLLASETPERLGMNAEEWLPCRYIAKCSRAGAPPAKRVDRQADGITRYYKMRATDAAFIATESSPKGWVAATHSLTSPDVWTNPARTCQHADASERLGANSSARISLRLYLLRGTARDAWAAVRRRV